VICFTFIFAEECFLDPADAFGKKKLLACHCIDVQTGERGAAGSCVLMVTMQKEKMEEEGAGPLIVVLHLIS
jgi:hypothetical protein